jgi:hypothetical protein
MSKQGWQRIVHYLENMQIQPATDRLFIDFHLLFECGPGEVRRIEWKDKD